MLLVLVSVLLLGGDDILGDLTGTSLVGVGKLCPGDFLGYVLKL